MSIVRWALALGLAAFLIAFGAMKFMGDNFIFAFIAHRSGWAFFEPGVRLLVGVAEVVAGALLIIPRTRGIGALLALGVIAGAIGFHLSPWLGVNAPAGFVDGAAQPYDSASDYLPGAPGLFVVACIALALAAAVVWLERARLPFVNARRSANEGLRPPS